MAQTPDDSDVLRPARDVDTAFFGHPRGLSVLFFSEMWERFSYYGMRAILTLFMVAPIAAGGMGYSDSKSGLIYGVYTAMVYLLGVPGGFIADKFLGLRKAVLYGGVLIMLGHISLAIPAEPTFFLGLGLVMLGTGLLKPNISTMVGGLYAPEDVRRDAGFSIYYMGINIGAFLSPLVCGYLAESPSFKSLLHSVGIPAHMSWHFGFGAAAVGMAFGLVQYVSGWRHMGDVGVRPYPAKSEAQASRNRFILVGILIAVFGIPTVVGVLAATGMLAVNESRIGLWFSAMLLILVFGLFGGLLGLGKWTRDERRRLLVIMLCFWGAIVLWAVFEQAGTTFTLFASRATNLHWLGLNLQASFFQSINAIMVIAFAPVFAFIWLRLARKRRDPSTAIKFAIGQVLLGAGMLLLVPAAEMSMGGIKVSPMWLVGVYLLHTWAELCISPVGLSAMTRLAPPAIGGMVMGIWFLGAGVGNYIAGRLGGLYSSFPLDKLLLYQVILPWGTAVVFFILSGPIKRMLGRTETEKAEI